MPKPKSLTILGVRGLRVHGRTPEGCDIELRHMTLEQAGLGDGFASTRHDDMRDAAVQVSLWDAECEGLFFDSADFLRADSQGRHWREVFRRAMKRYEKENKR